MTHKLGVYYAPSHDRPGDWDYIRNLQPPVVRILMPGDVPTNLVSRVHQAAPNARIALRWWDVDDGGESNKRAKLNNPEASAVNDAKTFFDRIQHMEFDADESGMPFPARKRLLVNALNEPPTWEHDKRPAIVAYNRTLITSLSQFGIPVAALCLAVGHPEEWPPQWDWAQSVIDAIHASPGSILELHSYWQLEGPNHIWTDAGGNQRKDWGALAGRYQHCPYDVPILMGEVGADGRLFDRKPQHTGWRGNISAQEYAAQLRFYLEHIHQDGRIIAALPFLTDTPDMESWGSFDTEQAHNDILAMVRSLPPIAPTQPATTKTITRLPSIVSPTPASALAFVSAPSGLNIRTAPINGDVLIAAPYAAQLRIIGEDINGWRRVRYEGVEGWAAAQYVSVEAPEPLPPEQPPNAPGSEKEAWTRSYAFVARWEGEYQNVHNDKGNWTGCEVGKGELKGTKYGISACSYPHLDIRNLTKEQAAAIYYTDYWQRSGAAGLAWPACLLVLDTAVLHGVGTAQAWLKEVGPNPYLFAARRLRSYTKQDNFDFWGKAWTLRVADLLEEVGR